MAKIPFTDNDFRTLKVFDVQEITTIIYSAELRSDYEEQSLYYGVLDSIIKKTSLLKDPDILPLISQFMNYGGRLGNVPPQYTALINFVNTDNQNDDGDDDGGDGDGDEGIDISSPKTYGTYYHVVADENDKIRIKNTKKLPPSNINNTWYFFQSLEEIRSYYKQYPDSNNISQIVVAKCFIDFDVIQKMTPFNPNDVPIFTVNYIYNYYVIVDDVFDYTLFPRFNVYNKVRRVKRGRK
jgi:hypothetical protein